MKSNECVYSDLRKSFHAALLTDLLTRNADGVVSNADSSNVTSKAIASGIADRLSVETMGSRIAGQTSGAKFEEKCKTFISDSFSKLRHLRPGNWNIYQITAKNKLAVAQFEQYQHLQAIDKLVKGNDELAAAIGSDYMITPDIVIVRNLEEDASINSNDFLVDNSVSNNASLRSRQGGLPLLHASISCKWTIRSDRAQNSRSEALNLIRNRKGRLPHIVVVTGEPLPSRLASLALGTGDIDCVYHFALYELRDTLKNLAVETPAYEDTLHQLEIMIGGNRLKDISDLPLDLAV